MAARIAATQEPPSSQQPPYQVKAESSFWERHQVAITRIAGTALIIGGLALIILTQQEVGALAVCQNSIPLSGLAYGAGFGMAGIGITGWIATTSFNCFDSDEISVKQTRKHHAPKLTSEEKERIDKLRKQIKNNPDLTSMLGYSFHSNEDYKVFAYTNYMSFDPKMRKWFNTICAGLLELMKEYEKYVLDNYNTEHSWIGKITLRSRPLR